MSWQLALAVVLALSCGVAFAAAAPPTLAGCASIVDDDQRLECFDQLAEERAPSDGEARDKTAATASPPPANAAAKPAHSLQDSVLADRWELGPENTRGTFLFRHYREDYLLVADYNFAPNTAPYRPLKQFAPDATLSHTEVMFQLSFKMKLLENVLNKPVDIWMAYTQQSYWQAYNSEASSPFRETNYEPELMAVTPLHFTALGMNARFVKFGLLHQSNGQTSSLSRSWNRAYAQMGFEQGDFVLLARVWTRLDKGRADNDNPDIIDYMGQGDLKLIYRWNGYMLSMLVRHNFHTGRGAVRAGWAFPLIEHLKGYVQLFSGYGRSLIDYDAYQNTVGVGVLVSF